MVSLQLKICVTYSTIVMIKKIKIFEGKNDEIKGKNKGPPNKLLGRDRV